MFRSQCRTQTISRYQRESKKGKKKEVIKAKFTPGEQEDCRQDTSQIPVFNKAWWNLASQYSA